MATERLGLYIMVIIIMLHSCDTNTKIDKVLSLLESATTITDNTPLEPTQTTEPKTKIE